MQKVIVAGQAAAAVDLDAPWGQRPAGGQGPGPLEARSSSWWSSIGRGTRSSPRRSGSRRPAQAHARRGDLRRHRRGYAGERSAHDHLVSGSRWRASWQRPRCAASAAGPGALLARVAPAGGAGRAAGLEDIEARLTTADLARDGVLSRRRRSPGAGSSGASRSVRRRYRPRPSSCAPDAMPSAPSSRLHRTENGGPMVALGLR